MKKALALIFLAGCMSDTGTPSGGSPDAPTASTSSFTFLYGDYFQNCKSCHTPTGAGHTPDTEQTLNFTSRATAYSTITTGMASGLQGNFSGCNTTPFITDGDPSKSLIVAVLDQPTRNAFDLSGHPMCDMDSITDETAKLTGVPAPSQTFIAGLKEWITDGAMDN